MLGLTILLPSFLTLRVIRGRALVAASECQLLGTEYGIQVFLLLSIYSTGTTKMDELPITASDRYII